MQKTKILEKTLDKLLPGGGSLEAVNLGGEEYDEEMYLRL